jgi:hypothetical protein
VEFFVFLNLYTLVKKYLVVHISVRNLAENVRTSFSLYSTMDNTQFFLKYTFVLSSYTKITYYKYISRPKFGTRLILSDNLSVKNR